MQILAQIEIELVDCCVRQLKNDFRRLMISNDCFQRVERDWLFGSV